MDLQGSGALAGGDKALFFSHQPLKGNPCEENTKIENNIWKIVHCNDKIKFITDWAQMLNKQNKKKHKQQGAS